MDYLAVYVILLVILLPGVFRAWSTHRHSPAARRRRQIRALRRQRRLEEVSRRRKLKRLRREGVTVSWR